MSLKKRFICLLVFLLCCGSGLLVLNGPVIRADSVASANEEVRPIDFIVRTTVDYFEAVRQFRVLAPELVAGERFSAETASANLFLYYITSQYGLHWHTPEFDSLVLSEFKKTYPPITREVLEAVRVRLDETPPPRPWPREWVLKSELAMPEYFLPHPRITLINDKTVLIYYKICQVDDSAWEGVKEEFLVFFADGQRPPQAVAAAEKQEFLPVIDLKLKERTNGFFQPRRSGPDLLWRTMAKYCCVLADSYHELLLDGLQCGNPQVEEGAFNSLHHRFVSAYYFNQRALPPKIDYLNLCCMALSSKLHVEENEKVVSFWALGNPFTIKHIKHRNCFCQTDEFLSFGKRLKLKLDLFCFMWPRVEKRCVVVPLTREDLKAEVLLNFQFLGKCSDVWNALFEQLNVGLRISNKMGGVLLPAEAIEDFKLHPPVIIQNSRDVQVDSQVKKAQKAFDKTAEKISPATQNDGQKISSGQLEK